MNLDYDIKNLDERKRIVQEIVDSGEHLSKKQLGYLADYLLYAADSEQTGKEKKREYPITTKNRNVTISKRQVSFEGVAESLPSGEDGIYSMIVDDKNALLDRREPITEEDIRDIPGMAEKAAVLENLKGQLDRKEGEDRYSIKRQIISTYQEMYTLKASRKQGMAKSRMNSQIHSMAHTTWDEEIVIGEDGLPKSNALVSLLRPDHVAFVLKYYSKLKQESWEDLNSDMHFLLLDLEDLTVSALLPDHAMLYDLVVMEVDGLTGSEIARRMESKWGIVHSEQYFSTLWCKRIPKMIAEEAQKRYLIWYYTFEHPELATWKICRTCGQKKLAHPLFFHKNTSKDGFYSKCRECRSKKNKR